MITADIHKATTDIVNSTILNFFVCTILCLFFCTLCSYAEHIKYAQDYAYMMSASITNLVNNETDLVNRKYGILNQLQIKKSNKNIICVINILYVPCKNK